MLQIVTLNSGVSIVLVANHDRVHVSKRSNEALLSSSLARDILAGMSEVTRILAGIEQGDPAAAEKLLPLVYQELRRLAATKLRREKAGQTLEATALVHEAFVRLVDGNQSPHWNSRGHFFCAAAEAMRRILVDRARRKKSAKAGGHLGRVQFNADGLAIPARSVDLVALDDALEELARRDARKAQLVKLRFFAGLSSREAAQLLGIAESTADADWAYAKSWLRLQMAD
jgi:RNA polymerase sigma factor (TIGR02999 family)